MERLPAARNKGWELCTRKTAAGQMAFGSMMWFRDLQLCTTVKQGDTTYYAAGRNSIEDGTAIAVYSNKNIYVGQFKDKKYEGKGVYYYADGAWYDGTWEEGIYNYCGEGRFDGTFKSGQLETGNMNRILDDGTITVEKYEDGKKL